MWPELCLGFHTVRRWNTVLWVVGGTGTVGDNADVRLGVGWGGGWMWRDGF